MTVVHTVADLRAARQKLKSKVGFVPTMGNLHEGHLNLVQHAFKDCNSVIASIFVNPAQFAVGEDLDKYPRTLERDLEMLKEMGTDLVFVPSVKEMYPSGIVLELNEQQGTFVEVKGKSHQMEGTIRPHFFRGVATVVCKLFNAVQPDKAYFGQKDAQQCVVVRTMVRDLLMPIEIVISPTMREKDGLAMSSRNGYLTKEDREAAPILYQGLMRAYKLFKEEGVVDRDTLLSEAAKVIETEKRVKLEYLSLAHFDHIKEIKTIDKDGAIISGAIKTTSTRLIDNLYLKMDQENDFLMTRKN